MPRQTTSKASSTTTKRVSSAAAKAFNMRLSRQKFASPSSLKVFPRPIQEQLRDHLAARTDIQSAKQRAQTSTNMNSFQYWLSFPQALRQFNTMPRFGQEPATVTNGATTIVPLNSIKEADEHWLMQTHPPFFNSGVGIFFDSKWHRVQAVQMSRHLNPNRQTRKLFIDVDACEDNNFQIQKDVKPLELKGVCDRYYFCGDQMEHPQKIFPIRGMALNPTTARRYTQPAHDVLVTAALLRGYVSPYWLTENQITRYFKLSLQKNADKDFVMIPGRTAVLIKLTSLPKDVRQQITSRFPTPADHERGGLTVALDGCNWEVVLHQNVLSHMSSKVKNPEEMELWVSLSMLRYMFQDWNKGCSTWSFTNCVNKNEKKDLADFLNSKVGVDNWIDQSAVTEMKLFNAEATNNPKLVLPQTKNVALCAGRPLHHSTLPTVVKHAFQKNFISPVWLTPLDVIRMPNLAIKAGERPLEISEGNATCEQMYNIDDLEEESVKKFLNEFPPPTDTSRPYTFLVKSWQQIFSTSKTKVLQETGRKQQLWLKHSEIMFQHLNLKEDAKATEISVSGAGRKTARSKARGAGDSVRRLFNAQQTTDPVRVVNLSLMKN